MQNDNRAPLDEKSLRILLVLSSKQSISVEEIAKVVDLEVEKVNESLKYLEHKHFVQFEKGTPKISPEGMVYLFEQGFQLPKIGKPTQSSQSAANFSLPLFGSWQDLIIWLLIIIISLILFMGLGLVLTYRIQNQTLHIAIVIVFGLLWFLILFLFVKSSYHSVPEYERLVIFRLGKCIGAKGPGPILTLPIDLSKTVDLRVKHHEVPIEACITQDNVQIDVDVIFYTKIQHPVWSITKVKDPEESIKLLASALLRSVMASFQFKDVLLKRESINDMLKQKINVISSQWGIMITNMEIREIKPPISIVNSMHKEREAEWNRQATMIDADAQAKALKALYEIATLIDDKTLSLKYFEMLKDLGRGESTKYIFPLELTELVKPLLQSINKQDKGNPTNGNNPPPADTPIGNNPPTAGMPTGNNLPPETKPK
jgi:regulator of protease activity HflC (stomatin/prohibitin superfamily)